MYSVATIKTFSSFRNETIEYLTGRHPQCKFNPAKYQDEKWIRERMDIPRDIQIVAFGYTKDVDSWEHDEVHDPAYKFPTLDANKALIEYTWAIEPIICHLNEFGKITINFDGNHRVNTLLDLDVPVPIILVDSARKYAELEGFAKKSRAEELNEELDVFNAELEYVEDKLEECYSSESVSIRDSKLQYRGHLIFEESDAEVEDIQYDLERAQEIINSRIQELENKLEYC